DTKPLCAQCHLFAHAGMPAPTHLPFQLTIFLVQTIDATVPLDITVAPVHGQPGIQRRAAVLQANAYIPTKAKQAYVGVALKWRTGLCLGVVIDTPIAVLAVQGDMHTRSGVFLPAHTTARPPVDVTIQAL